MFFSRKSNEEKSRVKVISPQDDSEVPSQDATLVQLAQSIDISKCEESIDHSRQAPSDHMKFNISNGQPTRRDHVPDEFDSPINSSSEQKENCRSEAKKFAEDLSVQNNPVMSRTAANGFGLK